MSKYILTTSGSKSLLLNIIKRNPDHRLSLYKSNTENTFILIDWLSQNSIFKSPISYQLLTSIRPKHYGPFINVYHFTLSHKELSIMFAYVKKQLENGLPRNMINLFLAQNTKNSSQIIVGSTWSNNKDLFNWTKSSFISIFLNNHTNNGFHNNLTQIR